MNGGYVCGVDGEEDAGRAKASAEKWKDYGRDNGYRRQRRSITVQRLSLVDRKKHEMIGCQAMNQINLGAVRRDQKKYGIWKETLNRRKRRCSAGRPEQNSFSCRCSWDFPRVKHSKTEPKQAHCGRCRFGGGGDLLVHQRRRRPKPTRERRDEFPPFTEVLAQIRCQVCLSPYFPPPGIIVRCF